MNRKLNMKRAHSAKRCEPAVKVATGPGSDWRQPGLAAVLPWWSHGGRWSLAWLLVVMTFVALLPASPAATPTPAGAPPVPLELKSPDGKVVLTFELKTIAGKPGCPVYRVSYAGRPVLVDSRLGLYDRMRDVVNDFQLAGQKTRSSDTTWKPVNGEREIVRDHYNELEVTLQMTGGVYRARRLLVTFRAYDAGIAFKYTVPREGNYASFEVTKEATQFVFAGNPQGWGVDFAQADYTTALQPLRKLIQGCERPLTVKLENNLYVAILEARNQDFARMRLGRCATADDGNNVGVGVTLDGRKGKGIGNNEIIFIQEQVLCTTPFTLPWRVVMVADSAGNLLEQNYLVQNLNDPCEITDTSWIKPGKVIRDVGLSTVTAKGCIDFAVKYGLQYILFDAGWYGPEDDMTSDARAVAPKLQAQLNMPEVIAYGKSKGVGVILYVNHVAMEEQLAEILPIYEQWGVAGVKYGFVNHGSQYWTKLTYAAIRKAAAHHLMVDVHDEFRSFGFERTYPNLMTTEGVHGDEGKPTPKHNAILPFTRYLAGPADHTFCWLSSSLKGTKAHQLAASTILYSPWQFLFWCDSFPKIVDEPALAYWRQLPTTWDETRVLHGDPGQRVVIARRKGAEWFIGAISPVAGKFDITLDFLPPGRKFTAHIYTDDVADATGKSVKVEARSVEAKSVVAANIIANGGLAMRIAP